MSQFRLFSQLWVYILQFFKKDRTERYKLTIARKKTELQDKKSQLPFINTILFFSFFFYPVAETCSNLCTYTTVQKLGLVQFFLCFWNKFLMLTKIIFYL